MLIKKFMYYFFNGKAFDAYVFNVPQKSMKNAINANSNELKSK